MRLPAATSAPPVTVTSACVGCGACLRTCPAHALRPARLGSPALGSAAASAPPGAVPGPVTRPIAPLVVLDTCTACGECIEICPVEAICE